MCLIIESFACVNALFQFLSSNEDGDQPIDINNQKIQAVCDYLAPKPEYFPLKVAGSGSEAWVFETQKGTILRVFLNKAWRSEVENKIVHQPLLDLTGIFYEECMKANHQFPWQPVIHSVSFLDHNVSVVEMEKLQPITDSKVYAEHHELLRMWEDALWDGESLEPTMTKMGELKNKGILPKDLQLVLSVSYFYNAAHIQEPSEHLVVRTVQEEQSKPLGALSQLFKVSIDRLTEGLQHFLPYCDVNLDMHPGNIMVRPSTQELVIIDPMSY